jgi:hypothetical protein
MQFIERFHLYKNFRKPLWPWIAFTVLFFCQWWGDKLFHSRFTTNNSTIIFTNLKPRQGWLINKNINDTKGRWHPPTTHPRVTTQNNPRLQPSKSKSADYNTHRSTRFYLNYRSHQLFVYIVNCSAMPKKLKTMDVFSRILVIAAVSSLAGFEKFLVPTWQKCHLFSCIPI